MGNVYRAPAMLSRRAWLAAASATLLAAPPPRIFLAQLYTVRRLLQQDPDRTLKAIADLGFTEVEGFNRAATIALAPKLKQYGLAARACTVETPLITNNWEPFPDLKPLSVQEAVEKMVAAGVQFFVFGYIPPGARGDGEDFFRRTADRMNAAAEICHNSGLTFVWQTHAFEFSGRPGFRPIDLYKGRLDTKLVSIEPDVFWLSMAGQDVVKLLRDWKGHVPLLRLNDRAKDTPPQTDEPVAQGAFVQAGKGVIEFAPILKAAAAAGVKYYSVGQDEVPGDPIASLRESLEYLKKI